MKVTLKYKKRDHTIEKTVSVGEGNIKAKLTK